MHKDVNRRHTREDALRWEEFRKLRQKCESLREKTLIRLLGVIGLRASEAAHVNAEWVDVHREELQIPLRCTCTIYCDGADPEDFKDGNTKAFRAKNKRAARNIPIAEMSPKTWDLVVDYVKRYEDEAIVTRRAVYDAVRRVADRTVLENVYPHSLRATAANYWANQGLRRHAFMKVFGWKDNRSARPYLDAATADVRNALEDIDAVDV